MSIEELKQAQKKLRKHIKATSLLIEDCKQARVESQKRLKKLQKRQKELEDEHKKLFPEEV